MENIQNGIFADGVDLNTQELKEQIDVYKKNRYGRLLIKTTAVRLYGKNDLRMETFELPPIKEDEILARGI